MNIYCQICGESVCSLHRVNTDKGVKWLCPSCMAKLRKIKREKK